MPGLEHDSGAAVERLVKGIRQGLLQRGDAECARPILPRLDPGQQSSRATSAKTGSPGNERGASQAHVDCGSYRGRHSILRQYSEIKRFPLQTIVLRERSSATW